MMILMKQSGILNNKKGRVGIDIQNELESLFEYLFV